MFVEELMVCADEKLEDLGFYAMSTCEGMDADPPSDECEKAKKQTTALILNGCSGRITDGCEVDLGALGCTSEMVRDLVVELADMIAMGNCTQAAACAAAVNEGTGLTGDTWSPSWAESTSPEAPSSQPDDTGARRLDARPTNRSSDNDRNDRRLDRTRR
jgi:hypothetical protein